MYRSRLMAALLLSLALASCGDSTPPIEPRDGETAERSDPLALVGRWHVEVGGQRQGAVRFGDDLTLFLPCGVLNGSWRADGQQSLFVGYFAGGDNECFPVAGAPKLAWLDAAAGYRVEGANRLLVDRDGTTVAVLRPGATPTVGPNRATDQDAPPTVSPELRARTRDVAPLPDGVAPVTADQLARRWLPAGPANSKSYLTFRADGSWTGSDGCNGQGGRFVLGTGGRLLTVSGPSTLIGCAGTPVGGWMSDTARAGLSGDRLVLYDASGREIGRLTAAS